METSNSSIDRLVRSKRRIQTLALVSGLFTCILSIVLMGVNYRLVQLNSREIDALNLAKLQSKDKMEASTHIENTLAKSESKIDELTKQLNAEKSLNSSLKSKLSQTLKQLAQIQEYANQVKSHSVGQAVSPTSSTNIGITEPHPSSQSQVSSGEKISPVKQHSNKEDLPKENVNGLPQQPKGSGDGPMQPNQPNITEPSVTAPQEPALQRNVSESGPPPTPVQPTAVSAESMSFTKTDPTEASESKMAMPQRESSSSPATPSMTGDTVVQSE